MTMAVNGSMGKQFWGKKTFCLITGSSQGIGRNFAIEFSRRMLPGSVLLLLARSVPGLEETKVLVGEANPSVHVVISSVDLSEPKPGEYLSLIDKACKDFDVNATTFDLVLLVNNAGSIGDVSTEAAHASDPHVWQTYLSLNVTSCVCITAQVLLYFKASSHTQKVIVNITSLCAIKPMKSMAYYCVGKAAREMYFKVLAEENPSIRVLNYSPGPVDTAMVTEVIENVGLAEVRADFEAMKLSKTLLTVDQTTARIISVLEDGNYLSGEHVDYFDTKI